MKWLRLKYVQWRAFEHKKSLQHSGDIFPQKLTPTIAYMSAKGSSVNIQLVLWGNRV